MRFLTTTSIPRTVCRSAQHHLVHLEYASCYFDNTSVKDWLSRPPVKVIATWSANLRYLDRYLRKDKIASRALTRTVEWSKAHERYVK